MLRLWALSFGRRSAGFEKEGEEEGEEEKEEEEEGQIGLERVRGSRSEPVRAGQCGSEPVRARQSRSERVRAG